MLKESEKIYDILYVEDEEVIRKNYVKFLKNYFKNVYEASDGEMAYQMYKEKKPQVMLVDIFLPKMSGIELVKRIRKIDHGVKIIMLTANSDVQTLLEATELKLSKYLVKPVTREQLKDAISLVMDEFAQFEVKLKQNILLQDGYMWNIQNEELIKNHTTIVLTNKEREVLKLLFSNTNFTYTYDEIIEHVWGYEYENSKVDALKTIIKNLRKKLPKECIRNIFGVGYKINLS